MVQQCKVGSCKWVDFARPGGCVTNWATLSRVLSMSKTLERDDFSPNFPINPVHGPTSRYCQFQPPQLQLIFRGFVRADKAGNNGPLRTIFPK